MVIGMRIRNILVDQSKVFNIKGSNVEGKDTNIEGGKLSGEKVTGNVGGDLNIESKQDKNSYEEKNSSAGIGGSAGISIGSYLGK